MPPEIGTEAPDFTMKDENGQRVTLSSYRGRRNVLVVFYPFAYSGICTDELCTVRDDLGSFQNDHAQVLAVSIDHMFVLKAWSVENGYQFPLLSDFWPHGEVAKAYRVFDYDRGMAHRGTFLVDKGGIVRFAEVNEPGVRRNQETWKQALAAIT